MPNTQATYQSDRNTNRNRISLGFRKVYKFKSRSKTDFFVFKTPPCI
ncbi:hypothetical protein CCAN12_460008 [Capnocytophaga canimorsus]|uniref:Uncharacterized protein n=2 Tax=Capnocytophaga TaxID=1016 RepID=A0A0B7H830_9FLAO|nr:hypothetical protein CCAN12_460008 [Capnocytophaga canimorsus]CEN35535.1 hypothetical protein CCYN2B_260038 [Capnocytophaga cynodegmi]